MPICTNRATLAATLLVACGDPAAGDHAGDDSSGIVDGLATDEASDTHGDAPSSADEADADDDGEDDDGLEFDVGAGDSGEDEGGAAESGEPGDCVDTTASAALLLSPCEGSVEFAPTYADDYECWEFVSLPGVLSYDGNTALAIEDPDLLLISGWQGGMVEIRVTRDEYCNITGFMDPTAVTYSASEPDDVTVRGMTYGTDGTMFLLRSQQSSPHDLGQRAPGGIVTSKLVDPMAMLPSWPEMTYQNPTVGLAVVPEGFPGAGALKMIVEDENSAHWYTLQLAPDGAGTYDIVGAVEETTIQPPDAGWGGYFARGVAYVGTENPQVDVPSVFITDSWDYVLAIYELDADGDPVPDTREVFAEGYGLGIPSGTNRDAVSGNYVVTGYRSNRLVVIRGFAPSPPPGDPRG